MKSYLKLLQVIDLRKFNYYSLVSISTLPHEMAHSTQYQMKEKNNSGKVKRKYIENPNTLTKDKLNQVNNLLSQLQWDLQFQR